MVFIMMTIGIVSIVIVTMISGLAMLQTSATKSVDNVIKIIIQKNYFDDNYDDFDDDKDDN